MYLWINKLQLQLQNTLDLQMKKWMHYKILFWRSLELKSLLTYTSTVRGTRASWKTLLSTKAPSTHIRIFFNPQFFLFGLKISPSTRSIFKSNSPVPSHPVVSGFTLVRSAILQCNVFRACAIKPAIVAANMFCLWCCPAILVYCSGRDCTPIYYVSGFENNRIHPSTHYGFV